MLLLEDLALKSVFTEKNMNNFASQTNSTIQVHINLTWIWRLDGFMGENGIDN